MSDKPRIAWCTPLDRKSAISRFSLLVTRVLAESAEIDLWVPQNSDLHLSEFPVFPISRDPRLCQAALREYDLVVYNMGNHFPFHGEIYRQLQVVPGVVILHDLVMHNFFYGALIGGRNDWNDYLNLIERTYGRESRDLADRAFRGLAAPLWTHDQVLRYPLFEPVIERALGVIVHSEWARSKVRQTFEGPLEHIFLAFDHSRDAHAAPIRKTPGRLLALSVGIVQPQKRITSVIRALAHQSKLSNAVEYVVAGAPGDAFYFEECQALITKHGLQNTVRLLGHVSDDDLHSYLAEADICLNLRFPNTESGSASLAEAMLSGKPLIAVNAGCYRDVPDDCLVKIEPDNEEADLMTALLRLVKDAEARRALGENARRFASLNYTAEAYVNRLLPFLDRVRSQAPMLRSIDGMGEILRAFGTTPGMGVQDAAANAFHDLFYRAGTP